ncbi:MAG TPA: alkaline phosphatase D family protein [Polyangiaceae bacterium]|nr:alkaline phosphatase D family protein [Polyangiaceae bacterium]
MRRDGTSHDSPLQLARFQAALDLASPESSSGAALVQLALPTSRSIVLWCVPPRGAALSELQLLWADGRPVTHTTQALELDTTRASHAARIEIPDLQANHTYELTVRVNGGAPVAVRAVTAPDASTRAAFSFCGFSCFAPFSKPNETPAVDELARVARLPSPGKPAFLLGMGDQVYVDPGGAGAEQRSLLSGPNKEELRYEGRAQDFFDALYRAHFSFAPFAEALANVPSAMMWDDHEIRDGWGSHGDEEALLKTEGWRQHVAAARRWFVAYQGLRNPAPAEPLTHERIALQESPSSPFGPELHFSFAWGALATFFVMDLRSQRSLTNVVSEAQLSSVRDWLAQRTARAGRVCVLVTPIPLTLPRWSPIDPGRFLPVRGDDTRDQWWSDTGSKDGAALRKILVEHFTKFRQDRLIILSGDVHYSEVRTITVPSEAGDEEALVIGHEVVASGLAHARFYPVLECVRWLEDKLPKFLDATLSSSSLGRYHGAAFVELFVSAPDDDGPPEVAVQFHPGAVALEQAHPLLSPRARLLPMPGLLRGRT